jgi:hypothetical protein
MRISGSGWIGAIAVMALVGCGGSATISGGTGGNGSAATGGHTGTGGSGTGTFTTSVPGTTKLTSLTAVQSAQLCSDLMSFVETTLAPALCGAESRAFGLSMAENVLLQNPSATDTELQAACAQAVASDAGRSCSTGTCDASGEPATCPATVADATKCINDDTAAVESYYASLPSCASLTAAALTAFFSRDGGSSQTEPASCSMFDSTCSQMMTTPTSMP